MIDLQKFMDEIEAACLRIGVPSGEAVDVTLAAAKALLKHYPERKYSVGKIGTLACDTTGVC